LNNRATRLCLPAIAALLLAGCAPMPWKIPDKAFLSFEDAAACRDFGDLSGLEFDSTSVFKLPFLCRTKYEDKIENNHYSTTEEKIDSFITSKLKPKFKFMDMTGFDTVQKEQLGKFRQAVLTNAANGKDTPLQWGHPFPPGIIGSRTIIYFPIGIERESGDYVKARFHVLILDSNGNVLFSRCMPYRADEWSTNIDIFKTDVQGKLPLLEQ
jgi:hypothetical protein